MQAILIGLTLLVSYCNGFIAPEHISSLVHLVDNVLPPMTIGTDSRSGFGFRLSNHADFQVKFEIGPQKFTGPLGKPFSASVAHDGGSNTIKRMANLKTYKKSSNAKKGKTAQKTPKPQFTLPKNGLLQILLYTLTGRSVKAKSSSPRLIKVNQTDTAKVARAIGTSPLNLKFTNLIRNIVA